MAAKLKPIRMAIVGCGRAGYGMHTRELEARGKMFQVVAACDPLKERRENMEKLYGCKTYKTLEELLTDDEVEMVDIATRSPDHVPHTLMALKAGKIVFLEKPIALSYQEAKKLLRATSKRPGKLFVRHNRRFEPTFQHIRELIASGILGEVFEIKLRRGGYSRRGDWQTLLDCGGGQLLNWGPHIVDHALRFLDGQVEDVWSNLRKIAAVGDAEDHVHIILKGGKSRFPCVVDLEISGGKAHKEPTYQVFGSKGSLSSDEQSIQLKYLDPKQKLPARRGKKGTPPLGGSFSGDETLCWIEKEIPVKPRKPCDTTDIWDHLYASIRKGKAFPITLEESLQVMEIISKARKGTVFDRF